MQLRTMEKTEEEEEENDHEKGKEMRMGIRGKQEKPRQRRGRGELKMAVAGQRPHTSRPPQRATGGRGGTTRSGHGCQASDQASLGLGWWCLQESPWGVQGQQGKPVEWGPGLTVELSGGTPLSRAQMVRL